MQLRKDSKIFRHFVHVVILTNVEVHARRDLASMKAFAPTLVKIFCSGSEALDYIATQSVDLVLCDNVLDDMDGSKFVRLLRKNIENKFLPVIMVTMENRKNAVLDAIAAGCVGYVLRPYSLETLERYLILAQQLEHYPEIESDQLLEAKDMVNSGNFDDAIEAFEEIVAYQDEAQRYYDMGCKYLLEEKYGKAIISFKKAVKINDLFAEAYKGLADAYRGKGDFDNCKYHLKKSAELYAQFDRLEEAKQVFIEILKYEGQTPNPFNSLGVKLRRQGDYPGAIHAYEQALKLTPTDENIYYNLAKAFFFMGNIEKARDNVTMALGINGVFAEAQELYKRVLGRDFVPAAGAPPPRVEVEPARSARDD